MCDYALVIKTVTVYVTKVNYNSYKMIISRSGNINPPKEKRLSV